MPSGLRRFQQSGQFHLLTFICYRRQAKLSSPDAHDVFVQCLAGCGKVVEGAKSLPQALKRLHIFDGLAARLKSGRLAHLYVPRKGGDDDVGGREWWVPAFAKTAKVGWPPIGSLAIRCM